MLHNNRAVAFARLGRLEEAKKSLDEAVALSDKDCVQQQIVIRATRGLIGYRTGNAVAGEVDYSAALEAATKARLNPFIARVYLYWVQEQVFAEPSCATAALEWLKPLDKYTGDHGFEDVLSAVKDRICLLSQAADPQGYTLASGILAPKGVIGQRLIPG
jgi:hypothetical protein